MCEIGQKHSSHFLGVLWKNVFMLIVQCLCSIKIFSAFFLRRRFFGVFADNFFFIEHTRGTLHITNIDFMCHRNMEKDRMKQQNIIYKNKVNDDNARNLCCHLSFYCFPAHIFTEKFLFAPKRQILFRVALFVSSVRPERPLHLLHHS